MLERKRKWSVSRKISVCYNQWIHVPSFQTITSPSARQAKRKNVSRQIMRLETKTPGCGNISELLFLHLSGGKEGLLVIKCLINSAVQWVLLSISRPVKTGSLVAEPFFCFSPSIDHTNYLFERNIDFVHTLLTNIEPLNYNKSLTS